MTKLAKRPQKASGHTDGATKGGAFSTYLSRLISNCLATRFRAGLRAAGELFPTEDSKA